MNRRILSTVLTVPTLVNASFWMGVKPVHAESISERTSVTVPDAATIEAQNCKAPQDGLPVTSQRKPQNALQVQTIGSGTYLLDPIADLKFTDAESDAAVARFGCDCPRHIRAIQAMAIQSPCSSATLATPAT